VATARRAFGERGLGASLDDIAKCAGVGSGTLYRHFPTRDDLVAAVFVERMAEQVTAVEVAGREPDPWNAFAGYVRSICRAQAGDKALADLFAIGHGGDELRALRTRAYEGVVALIDAAAAASERFVSLALDGLRAEGATAAPPALSPRASLTAIRRDQAG
jgi:AcrR family transcriptional regulator